MLTANSNLKKKKSRQRFSVIGNLLLAFAVAGYPLSAGISAMLGLESSDINISYRISIGVLSAFLILWSIFTGRFRLDILLITFLFVYTIRMTWDFYFFRFPGIERDFQFYLIATLLPAISAGAIAFYFDEIKSVNLISVIGFLACLLIIYQITFHPDTVLIEALENRAAFSFLNPISIGYLGLYLCLSALIIRYVHFGGRYILWPLLVFVGGSYLLVVSGSRGPIVALVLALLFTGLANASRARVYSAVGFGVALLLVYAGAPEVIRQRFISVGVDASSLERLYVIDSTYDLAFANPWFGYGYVEPSTNVYPHNLLLEAWLALGLAGLCLMAWIQLSMIFNAWRLARRGEWLMPFLAITAVANAWMSGSIWGGGLFFIIAWIVRDRAIRNGISYRQ